MGYSMISDVGGRMVSLLAQHLVPELIASEDGIGLCSPEEHGDLKLCLYLYDISLSKEVPPMGMVNTGLNKQSYPSTFLTLHYMVTAFSGSDIKYRAAEEHKILGRVVQVFQDYGIFSPDQIGEDVTMAARIEQVSMDQGEKLRLWNFPDTPYKLSLFYKVGPIEIPSDRTREITRVTSADFTLKEGEGV